jgi:hypothetical protein
MGACSSSPTYRCRFDAKVIGKEQVSVPAGSFDAWKVEVQLSVHSGVSVWTREYTYWYAEIVRRMVKYTARGNERHDSQVNVELASYRLQ